MFDSAKALYGRCLRAVSRRLTIDHTERTNARFDAVETRLAEHAAPPLWLYRNYTEPRVNYAMHDLVRPGQVVFDVGCNFGGLTAVLSRLVGPQGIVCAFEANPAIAAKCQMQLARSGAFNAHIYQGAVYRRSGKTLDLYLSENSVADSIYRETENKIPVRTIALDDFVSRFQLIPDFVKMDIEGAEADALLGFERTIDAYHPTLVLEHTRNSEFCLNFLLAKGYQVIDLQDYRRIRSSENYADVSLVTDFLYAMPDRLSRTPYGGELEVVKVMTLSEQDFHWIGPTDQRSSTFDLKPGRYLATLSLSASGEAEAMCGVWDVKGNSAIMRVHTLSGALPTFGRRIVFDFSGGTAQMFVHFVCGPDPSFRFDEVEIWRVPAFDAFRAPPLATA